MHVGCLDPQRVRLAGCRQSNTSRGLWSEVFSSNLGDREVARPAVGMAMVPALGRKAQGGPSDGPACLVGKSTDWLDREMSVLSLLTQ